MLSVGDASPGGPRGLGESLLLCWKLAFSRAAQRDYLDKKSAQKKPLEALVYFLAGKF